LRSCTAASQVAPVEIQQVEGDQHDPVRVALQLVLQDGKIRGAVVGRRDDLAVDDGTPGADVPGVGGDLPEPVGSVVTAPSEYLDSLAGEMDLDAIAVELDFMNPPGAAGLDEPREGVLTPWTAGFRRCNATEPNSNATRSIQSGTVGIVSGQTGS
jgi:hypothetical protein